MFLVVTEIFQYIYSLLVLVFITVTKNSFKFETKKFHKKTTPKGGFKIYSKTSLR